MTTITCPVCGAQVQLVANGICPSCQQRRELPEEAAAEQNAARLASPSASPAGNPFAAPQASIAPNRSAAVRRKRYFFQYAAVFSCVAPFLLLVMGVLIDVA